MAMGRLGGRSLWGYVWAEEEGDERGATLCYCRRTGRQSRSRAELEWKNFLRARCFWRIRHLNLMSTCMIGIPTRIAALNTSIMTFLNFSQH
jgi:hypothetical protein